MEIKIKNLSKDALLVLVEALHKNKPFPDDLLAALFRDDLVRQLNDIAREQKKIEALLVTKKISVKDHNDKAKRYNSLNVLGKKKLAILKELNNATN